jgi:hypothetical protein
VQVREQDEPFAKTLVLLAHRLLDLQQKLGLAPHLLDRHDARADIDVHVVRERASLARTGLDEHVVAAPSQLEGARRCERNAVLVRLDLFCDTDLHARATLHAPSARDTCALARNRHIHGTLSSIRSQRVVGWGAPAE